MPRPAPSPEPEPQPQPKATWTNGFGPGIVAPEAGVRPRLDDHLPQGLGRPPRSHAGESPTDVARIVAAELLILRFELECSIDLFTRSAEDRNLSCSLHVSWPVVELADRAQIIPGAAKTLKKINEAFKARSVRKHALKKQSNIENGRFEGWLTYPTAVMASEALEAFRGALALDHLEVEKQIREMAIPRPRG